MNIIGVNFGHDAAVTLLRDGRIARSIEEEKLSRVKQDHGWPAAAIERVFSQESLTPADIDVVAFGSRFYDDLAPGEIRYRFTKQRSEKNREYAARIASHYTGLGKNRFGEANRQVFEKELAKRGFGSARVEFWDHHLSHAAGAWYCAPFAPDLVITADGQGDAASFNFYRMRPGHGLELIEQNSYAVSIGAFYSAITKLLGFRPTRHEGKITGLAAFGRPTDLVESFTGLFSRDAAGRLVRFPGPDVDRYWKQYGIDAKLPLDRRINLSASACEVARDYARRFEVLRERLGELMNGHSKEDVAFACQYVTEQVIVEEVRRIIRAYCPDREVTVALAGGVFANVRVNQAIYEMPEVSNVFVQPAMGDSGLAIGAAILADVAGGKRDPQTDQYRFQHTYLGPDFDADLPPFLASISGEAQVVKMTHPAREVAEMIRDNKVVGFWHGSMEWGPRALGRRSIMLNTFDRSVNDRLNQRLTRTEFMPFAPSVIDRKAQEYFPEYDAACPAGDYMTITYDVPAEHHEMLQAVVHVDGTARPQVVRREINPYYYDIIDEYDRLTGCGAVVNTSFNAHEEPIVSTPASAYKALREDRVDVLVLEDYKITLR